MIKGLYRRRDLVTGLLIYGTGDSIAALLAGEFLLARCLGMAAIGALLYGLEIPHYFRWVSSKSSVLSAWQAALLRALLAMLYFNPLWVARHLFFIHWFSGAAVDSGIFLVALQSFITALPLTVLANLLIQNGIPLTYRFAASALFSCLMAIVYPLLASFLS